MNLSEFQSLSAEQLSRLWVEGSYPFEMLDCGECLTMHVDSSKQCHTELRKALQPLRVVFEYTTNTIQAIPIVKNDLFAIRQEFDHLFTKEQVETSDELVKV